MAAVIDCRHRELIGWEFALLGRATVSEAGCDRCGAYGLPLRNGGRKAVDVKPAMRLPVRADHFRC